MASPTQVRSDVPNFGTGEKECNRQCFRPCGYQRSALGTDAWGETPFRWRAGEHGGEIEGVGRRRGERVSPGERRSQSAPRTLGTRRERDEKPGSRSKGSQGVAGDPRSAGVSACRIACVSACLSGCCVCAPPPQSRGGRRDALRYGSRWEFHGILRRHSVRLRPHGTPPPRNLTEFSKRRRSTPLLCVRSSSSRTSNHARRFGPTA